MYTNGKTVYVAVQTNVTKQCIAEKSWFLFK